VPSGKVQRFADRAGGPAMYEGTGYQTGVAVVEALGLLAHQQQSPLAVLRLRCETRLLARNGQLGFDLGVEAPHEDRQLEMKSSPVKADVVEIIERLSTVAGHPSRLLQLVHGKATRWTEAMDLLQRNAGEAADDAELATLASASGDADRQYLFSALASHQAGPRALLAHLAAPSFLPPVSVERLAEAQAKLLAGDRADELIRQLTELLTKAFKARKTLLIHDVHAQLVDAGLIYPVTVVAPPADPRLTRAVGVLDQCRAPLPERILSHALGLPPGGARALLGELIDARVILDDGESVWRPRLTHPPIPRSIAGSVARDVLEQLVTSPPPSHLQRMAQVPNVLALAEVCLADEPDLVARSFHPYDKAAKATGDLSSVYLLARRALEASTHAAQGDPQRDAEVMWLRAHARICGTSWTLQRVGHEVEASEEMDTARRESLYFNHRDNLAFVDKCQGRLSRLRAERFEADGHREGAAEMYDKSRTQLASAHKSSMSYSRTPDMRSAIRRSQESAWHCGRALSCRLVLLRRPTGTPQKPMPSWTD
jgi:hypothetical protein